MYMCMLQTECVCMSMYYVTVVCICYSTPAFLQIAFTQACAQQKAKEAASNMRTHTDLDGEEEGHTPNPLPLTSPSHVVRKWTGPSPEDTLKLRPHGSARKV